MRLAILLSLVALPLAACGPMEEDPDHHSHTPPPTSSLHDGRTALSDDGAFKVTWRSATEVPMLGTNTLTLELTTPAGEAISDADVTLELFMPMHGHGSSATPVVTALGLGHYEATNVVFQMAGEWHLTVRAIRGAIDDGATFVLDIE